MSRPTVGLCVMIKDVTPELQVLLKSVEPYVDVAYVQINGKGAEAVGQPEDSPLQFSLFQWCDDFAAARNALLAEVKTDYWLWMDSDDVLQGAEHIRDVVTHMEATAIDIMFADYIYQRNEQGLPTEVQRRERIFKTGTPGEWVGAIHETFIPRGTPETENTELIKWVHEKTKEMEAESNQRNEKILRKEWFRTGDPRIAYYLGLNQAIQGKYDAAIRLFNTLIEKGGWDEERYRAHLQIASCYQQQQKYREAVQEYLNATNELPGWPDAYYGLQQVYYEIDDHEKSIHWFEIGQSRIRPDTDSAYNPVVIEMQPLLLAALSYLFVGQVKRALAVGRKLKKIAPGYGELAKLEPEILRAYNEEQAIEAAKTLIRFNSKYDGEPVKVLDALPATLRADVRLTAERRELIPGKVWPKGSIVFYCGQNYEPWGPEYLDGGMGGSEEAVVYLARELARDSGREVTVYNERMKSYLDYAATKHMEDDVEIHYAVDYRPWTEINPNDDFDVFVAWRDPGMCQYIKARVKLCDVHDALSPGVIYANQEWVDKYMFKSQYHRNLYPELPDNKCMVVSNGILRSQFK